MPYGDKWHLLAPICAIIFYHLGTYVNEMEATRLKRTKTIILNCLKTAPYGGNILCLLLLYMLYPFFSSVSCICNRLNNLNRYACVVIDDV